MIHQNSDTEMAASRFVDEENRRMDAVKRQDVPAANHHFAKGETAAQLLESNANGRRAMEELMHHPLLHIRLSAAEHVLSWDPTITIPFLGRLLDMELLEIVSVDEKLDIRTRAKDALYRFFGIESSNRNDLIEPLRAYGVELPWRDHARWQ
jgi:hypothetical protein